MGYCLNRLDEPVFLAVSKPLRTEFRIHHRLESCGHDSILLQAPTQIERQISAQGSLVGPGVGLRAGNPLLTTTFANRRPSCFGLDQQQQNQQQQTTSAVPPTANPQLAATQGYCSFSLISDYCTSIFKDFLNLRLFKCIVLLLGTEPMSDHPSL